MSDLKTLKDFNKEKTWKKVIVNGEGHYVDISDLILIEDLKAEAVKWVKKMSGNFPLGDGCLKCDKYPVCEHEGDDDYWLQEWNWGTVKWIKHFFNLTEDDLK